ncbi:MAG: polyprenol monophosphomannose synthase, partial [Chloroflexi bacterium]|nr:polyprenol monophosphomannose synthase [Chloroflexota bacterium]
MQSLVVLPTYNEASNIESMVRDILIQGAFDILIVDDNSPDGTGRMADELSLENPGRIEVLHREEKRGLGSAYVAGFGYALGLGFPYIFQMDADFSHNPADLPRMVAELEAGADVVIGSRYVPGGQTPGWTVQRRLLSRAGSFYARTILGLDVQDPTGGFRGFRREVIERLDLGSIRSNGFAFQIETAYRCCRNGFRIAEIPITFVDRRLG